MKAIVDTITSIDENSKKILFKHFDQHSVNILSKKAPILLQQISMVASEAAATTLPNTIDSDMYESDSSGNQSEHDEVNRLQKLKQTMN